MARNRKTLEEAFGQVVRDCRSAQELSQKQLGFEAGIHRNYVGMIERTEKSPTLSTIQALAAASGMGPHELLKRAEEALPSFGP